MYGVTFRKSAWGFVKQLFSPAIISMIIAAVLLPIQYATKDMNIFLTLIVKSIFSFCIFGVYIQVTREYNIIKKVKDVIRKKNVNGNHQQEDLPENKQ